MMMNISYICLPITDQDLITYDPTGPSLVAHVIRRHKAEIAGRVLEADIRPGRKLIAKVVLAEPYTARKTGTPSRP